MAISEAMKHYDDRITAMQIVLEAKLEAGFKSMDGRLSGVQTTLDVLKWAVITQGTLLVLAGAIISYVKLLA
jgi:hypothetical protein